MYVGVTPHVTPTHLEHGMEPGMEPGMAHKKEAPKRLHFAQNRSEESDQVLVTDMTL
jgi:hypothetical protein